MADMLSESLLTESLKTCPCGVEFIPSRISQVYCSSDCIRLADVQRDMKRDWWRSRGKEWRAAQVKHG